MAKFWKLAPALLFIILGAGCAFDVIYLKEKPVTFTAANGSANDDFVLKGYWKVEIGTGYPTFLRGDTHWHCVGTTEYGRVYSTRDQLLTVEASNIYEAFLVVADQTITGFYLPVEKIFTPASHPVHITTESI